MLVKNFKSLTIKKILIDIYSGTFLQDTFKNLPKNIYQKVRTEIFKKNVPKGKKNNILTVLHCHQVF